MLAIAAEIIPDEQTITFETPSEYTLSGISSDFIEISASSDSGLDVALTTTTPDVCDVFDNTVFPFSSGDCEIIASQAGNEFFNPAPDVIKTIIINKADQEIFVENPTEIPFIEGGVVDIFVGSSSGLPITLIPINPEVCDVFIDKASIEIPPQIIMLNTGLCELTAFQDGDEVFNPAPSVNISINLIGKSNQAITLIVPPDQTFFGSEGSVSISAISDSRLEVTLTSNTPMVCTAVDNTLVNILGVGTCELTASQAGDEAFNPAEDVTQSFNIIEPIIEKIDQTITFITPPDQIFTSGRTFPLSVNSDSGLPVTVTATNTDICSVSGTIVTIQSVGVCELTASQVGDETFNPAMDVTQNVIINKSPQTISLTIPASPILVTDGNFNAIASSNSGLEVTIVSNNSAICTVADSNTVEGTVTANIVIKREGICNLTASQAGDDIFAPAEDVNQTMEIIKASQTITFNPIADQTFVSGGTFEATASSDSGLPVTVISTSPDICTIVGTTVTMQNVGACNLTASQAGNEIFAGAEEISQAISIGKASQTITFNPIADQTFVSGGTFEALASSDSGLPVSITSTSRAVCTIVGTTVTMQSVGACNLTASQAGDATFAAAEAVDQTVGIGKASQTITFSPIADQTFVNGGTFEATASSDSGLPVTITSTSPDICTIAGTTVTMQTVGSCNLTASQAGDETFAAAEDINQTVGIGKASQSITFNSIADQTFVSGGTFEAIASSDSGLPVIITSTSPAVCTIAGTIVTMQSVGVCNLTASQVGNETFAPAENVSQTVSIGKASQMITFNPIADQTFVNEGTFEATASSDSGLPVTVISTSPDICTIVGTTVTMQNVGACNLTASQAGNEIFAPAEAVNQTVSIGKASQTITFNPIADQTFVNGGTFEVTASSDSGLPVAITSISPDICTIVGTTVTMQSVGACNLTASQAGDATFAAAEEINQTVGIGKASQTITFNSIADQTFVNGGTFEATASSDSGLPVTITSTSPDICTIVGTTVMMQSVGACNLMASQLGDEIFAPAEAVNQTVGIGKVSQTITFNPIANQTFVNGGMFEATASSDSGLPVIITSTSPDICTITGNTVTMQSVGACNLTASQAGDETFAPAESVNQTVGIGKASQTITFNPIADQTFVSGGSFEAIASSDSGLPVSITSTSPAVCTIAGTTVTMQSVGACNLTASQAGDETFAPAEAIRQAIGIGKAAQIITFNPLTEQTFTNGASFEAIASSDSGLAVTIVATNPDICSISDSNIVEGTTTATVLMQGVGTCNLTASQEGDEEFIAALDVTQAIAIQPSPFAPVITEGEQVSVIVGIDGQNPAFNLTLNATDTDEDVLTWRISSNASQGIANVEGEGNSKVIGYVLNTPATANNDSFVVEVSDGASIDTIIVNVFIIDSTINPVSDADSNNNGISDRVEAIFGATDSDGDGIPNELENSLGRDVTAITDTDNDGMPDVGEILIGRDPDSDDSIATNSPIITVASSPLTLAAKGTVSAYRFIELGISTTLDANIATPTAYFKNGACVDGVPYNYEVVCNQVPNSGYLSGVTEVWWLLTDAQGNWGRNEQTLNILPQVNFEVDAQVLSADNANNSVTMRLVLSGDTVFGDAFVIPFTVSGSAQTPTDYNVATSQFQFQGNALSSDPVTVNLGNAPSNGSELIVTLDANSNVFNQPNTAIDPRTQFVTAGNKLSHVITIVQNQQFAPRLANLKGTQSTGNGRFFDKINGNVTLSFDLIDPDGGVYTFSWVNSSDTLRLVSGSALNTSTVPAPVIDISRLAIGRYFIEAQVTDNSSNATTKISAIITIVGGLTLSSSVDTDGDGIVDSIDGLGDDDNDGVPNYLDAQNNQSNVLPTQSDEQSNFLVRTEAGLSLLFGKTASAANKSGINVSLDDLANNGDNGEKTNNSQLPNVTFSRIFDYEIEGINVPLDANAQGNSVAVVFPLLEALTADTAFFKYDTNGGWRPFAEDASNHIEWAGFANNVRGNCPETTSSAYTSDANQKIGKQCIRLTIQDGGANDADGVVDGRIVDPLGIAEPTPAAPSITTATHNANTTSNGSGGGGHIDLLLFLLLFVWGIAYRYHSVLKR